MIVTEKTGNLISLKNVSDDDDLMVINKSGITIRIAVDTLREMGRATQGVKIIRLKYDDSIASVANVSRFEVQEDGSLEEEEGELKNEGSSEEINKNANKNINESKEDNNNQNENNNEEN